MYDPNSVTDSDSFSTKHLHLDWNVDFSKRVITGSAKLTLQRLQLSATYLLLDAKALHITAVRASDDTEIAVRSTRSVVEKALRTLVGIQ
jgi:leukotriene-A4 hydrolase